MKRKSWSTSRYRNKSCKMLAKSKMSFKRSSLNFNRTVRKRRLRRSSSKKNLVKMNAPVKKLKKNQKSLSSLLTKTVVPRIKKNRMKCNLLKASETVSLLLLCACRLKLRCQLLHIHLKSQQASSHRQLALRKMLPISQLTFLDKAISTSVSKMKKMQRLWRRSLQLISRRSIISL